MINFQKCFFQIWYDEITKLKLYFLDCLLDLDMFTIYERIKSFYSEQLFIWGLSSQRLCVLKASSCQESQQDQEEHDNLKVAKSQMVFFQFVF